VSRRSILAVGGVVAAVAASPDVHVTLTSGALALQSTRDGQAIVVNASGLRPGEARTGDVTVHNGGSVAGDLSFAVEGPLADVPASPALSQAVQLRLERCGAGAGCPSPQLVIPQSGTPTLADLAGAAPAALGSIAAGEDQTYRVTLTFASSDPNLQGAATSATLGFTARSGS
jgi:hypothetical protein